MDKTNLKAFLEEEEIVFSEQVDLKSKTRIKHGGIAKFWVQPTKIEHFENLVQWCQIYDFPFEVIGGSSNFYFDNNYNPTLVISTLRLTSIKIRDDQIKVECGYGMIRLSNFCIENGFSGYEGFIGLPGTVAGAVINNAGCYGALISDVMISAEVMEGGVKKTLYNKDFNYSHRSSNIKNGSISVIILSVCFDCSKKENKEVLLKRAQEFKTRRLLRRENMFPSLGTTIASYQFLLWHRILYKVCRIIGNIFYKQIHKRALLKTRIFLFLTKSKKFKDYISPSGIQSFMWKDEGADEAFAHYLDFFHRTTKSFQLEIEIKKDNEDRNPDISSLA
jgi:UDP-N-acetylmuramate dehydrogenase